VVSLEAGWRKPSRGGIRGPEVSGREKTNNGCHRKTKIFDGTIDRKRGGGTEGGLFQVNNCQKKKGVDMDPNVTEKRKTKRMEKKI